LVHYWPVYSKSGFLKGRRLSSQSEQFKKYSKSSDWLEKAGPPKCSLMQDWSTRCWVGKGWLPGSSFGGLVVTCHRWNSLPLQHTAHDHNLCRWES